MKSFTNNWSLKLISVVLAILLWSHVRGEVNPLETTTVEAPLRVRAPRGFVVANAKNLPSKVNVILRGPRLSLRNVRSSSLSDPLTPTEPVPSVPGTVRASIEWNKPRAGEQDAALRANCSVNEIEVLSTQPAQLSITLQKRGVASTREQVSALPRMPKLTSRVPAKIAAPKL